jgi:glycerol-3-phosphate dehydrogenase (NAD(P)+)
MARIVILGAGMMGTAFAWPLADRGHSVRLVGTHLDHEIVEATRQTRVHPKLGLAVPDGVEIYPVEDLGRALDGADGIALGVSSAGVRWAGLQLARVGGAGLPLAMVSKGLEWNGTELRVLPDVLVEALGAEADDIAPVAVAGPCIAGELARRVPTAVVFTGRSPELNDTWAGWVRGPYYHVWTTTDVVGAEVCAALKNAYAMGIALAQGLHERAGGQPGSIALHNYEAAVFAQSIWEMQKLIRLLGGDTEQAAWLPGVGDLDVTCNGGRTGKFGRLLGLGLGRDEAIARMQGATLECLEILKALREATAAFIRGGRLAAGALPLAEHLAAIALDGSALEMPFERFFTR